MHWLTDQKAHFVNEIDDLQIDATKNLSQDFIAIDSLHAKVESLIAQFPPWIAAKNRDTSHDTANPSLRAQTELTISRAYSLLVGLHRPYVFSREQSRVQIVKNGVMVIESQNRLLGCLKEHQQQLYTMSFLIFDPAVLTSAVVITSPMSLEQDLIDSALVALRTGARQLEESGRHVKIAEKGGAVLKLLVKKAEAVSAECLQLRKASRSRSSSSSLDSPSAYSPPAHLVSSSQGSPVPYSAQVLGYDSRAPWIPPPPPPSSFQCNSMEFTPSYELDEILMLADMGSEIGFGAQTIGGMEGVDIFWQNQLYGGVG